MLLELFANQQKYANHEKGLKYVGAVLLAPFPKFCIYILLRKDFTVQHILRSFGVKEVYIESSFESRHLL